MEILTYITKPYLPDLEEFIPYLEDIWNTKSLTNCGKYHYELEEALCNYFEVKYISLFANGTIALMTAVSALELKGEILTTPYSFVATTNALIWNNIKPVFVDIDPLTTNIDPTKLEAAITKNTVGIMPVHCYGHPADTTKIKEIADKYNLKVIYDAAHAFGVKDDQGTILRHGDLSVLSFHATKVFNTFEGGAIVCHDANMKARIDQLKNFGYINESTINFPGMNGKMSEFNAALGLLQLKYLEMNIKKRQLIDQRYRENLKDINGIVCLEPKKGIIKNYAYFPILVTRAYPLSRDEICKFFLDENIILRRYFWPLISNFSICKDIPSASLENLPVANLIADQVICLPIYPSLEYSIVENICTFLNKFSKEK